MEPKSDPQPTTPSKPRRRLPRSLRWGILLLALPIAIILSLPWFLSADFVRTRVERSMASALGAEVQLGSYDLGWFSGFSMGRVEISNPPGFDQSVKALVFDRARGDLSFWSLLSGKVDVEGSLDGLEVRVQQRADGTTNFGAMFGVESHAEGGGSTGGSESPPPEGADLANVRLNLAVSDGRVEIEHEDHGVIESLRDVQVRIAKDYGARDIKFKMESSLLQADTATPGSIEVDVDVDPTLERPVRAEFSLVSVDLERYRPVLASFLPAGDLVAFAGLIGGSTQAFLDLGANEIRLEGNLNVERPHFAGAAFAGMNVRGEHWVVSPNLTVSLPDEAAPVLDAQDFRMDLGFLQLRGMASAAASEAAGGVPAMGVTFDVDLQGIAALGGPIPPELGGTPGSVTGHAVLPVERGAELVGLGEALASRLMAELNLSLGGFAYEGHTIADVGGSLKLHKGKARAEVSALVAGGPAKLTADLDPTVPDEWPCDLALSWSGGHLRGPAADLLQYAVPILAGLDSSLAPVDFTSNIGCELKFHGPLMPKNMDQPLAWLNQWSGGGNLQLSEGGFAPAQQFGALLQLIGEDGKVDFRGVTTDFAVANGFITTEACRLVQDAAELVMVGKTGLDGSIDYTLDVTQMLQRHGDGQKVLKALGGSVPAIKLQGSLTEPRVQVPDLIGEAARQGLQQATDKLLEKGLNEILRRRK